MKHRKSGGGYFDELAKITELRRQQAQNLPTDPTMPEADTWRSKPSSAGSRLKVRKLPGRRSWSN